VADVVAVLGVVALVLGDLAAMVVVVPVGLAAMGGVVPVPVGLAAMVVPVAMVEEITTKTKME
jgi:hypothetical protein